MTSELPSTEGIMREVRRMFGPVLDHAEPMRDVSHLVSNMLLTMEALAARSPPETTAQNINEFAAQCGKQVEAACRDNIFGLKPPLKKSITKSPPKSSPPVRTEETPEPVFVQHQVSIPENLPVPVADHQTTEPIEHLLLELRGVRLLFVEDIDIQRKMIGYKLSRDGLVVSLAEHGVAALTQVEQHNGPFDIIVTDISMPVMNGHELLDVLRGRGFPGPIMCQTGHALDSDKAQLTKCGFDYVLTKPFNYDQLLRAIHWCVEKDGTYKARVRSVPCDVVG